ncbi:MAG: hypothetical protein ACFFCO_07900, partial [Promethearchaeota archaeon]
GTVAPLDDTWYQVNVSIPYDHVQTWTLPTVTLRLGFGWVAAEDTRGSEWTMDFDNVALEVTGMAEPDHSWVQLRMNNTAVTSSGYGSGTVNVTGNWPNPGTTHSTVQALWETYSSNSSGVYFDYDLTLYITRESTTEQQTGPDGTSFSAQNDSVVYWTAWYYAYTPYYFEDYNLTIAKPTTETWTLYSVFDAFFTNRTSAVFADSNSTHIKLSHATINDVFGWWNFTFTSSNQVTSVNVNDNLFQITPNTPNTLSVSATFGKSTGESNLTLYDPFGTVVAEDTQTVAAGAATFNSITFDNGTEFPVGVYTLCISYDNGVTPTQTAAGFNSTYITVEHGTTTLIPQVDTMEVVRESGTYFYPRVRFYDNDTYPDDTFLEDATVVGNWTGSDSFGLVGGFYLAELPTTTYTAGNYTLRVNATKQYHADAYCLITIQVVEKTTLSSPDSPGITEPYNETVSVSFFYERTVDSTGITGATVTSDWPNAVNPTSEGSGWYNFTVDTGDVDEPGTYQMVVTAQRPSYQQQSFTLTVVVRERNTHLSPSTPSTLPINELANFTVTLQDLDLYPVDYLPTNASTGGRIRLTIWYSGSLWNYASITEFSAGIWNVSIDTSYLVGGPGQYTFTVNFSYYSTSGANSPFYANRTTTVIITLRQVNTDISYTTPNPEPWGNTMNVTITYYVDDPASSLHGTFPSVSTISCTLNGTPLVFNINFTWVSLGGGQYRISVYASVLTEVGLYELYIQVTPSSTDYQSASRSLSFIIQAHQTQTVVDPPDPTGYGFTTPIFIEWTDLETSATLSDSVLDYVDVRFKNGTWVSTEYSLSFTLDTSTWNFGTYNLTVTVYSNTTFYLSSQGNLRIQIRTHATAAVVEPPTQTPWGWETWIVIQWTDLENGGSLTASELDHVDVRFANNSLISTETSLSFWLDTSGWNLGSETLTIILFANLGYEDANTTVQVIIRAHRIQVVVPTPEPTAWGRNTTLTVEWYDLDNQTLLTDTELSNVTITDCPVGGDQIFTTLGPFTLITTTWSVTGHLVNVTIYPGISFYQIGSYQVTITIRAHYVSVTIDPPAQTPWGGDTDLVVNWWDVDTATAIPVSALVNVTATGCPVGGDQTFFGSLSFTLVTDSWGVNSFSLTVWVFGNASYYVGSGPVTVVIRAHQTQTIVAPPEQTPFDFNTSLTVQWVDLDLGSTGVPSG